jgi:hypothetical protein
VTADPRTMPDTSSAAPAIFMRVLSASQHDARFERSLLRGPSAADYNATLD